MELILVRSRDMTRGCDAISDLIGWLVGCFLPSFLPSYTFFSFFSLSFLCGSAWLRFGLVWFGLVWFACLS